MFYSYQYENLDGKVLGFNQMYDNRLGLSTAKLKYTRKVSGSYFDLPIFGFRGKKL